MTAHAFHALTNFAAAAACLGYGLALRVRVHRPRLFVRFSALLFLIGIGMACRGVHVVWPSSLWSHALHAAFSLTPVAAALFAEDLSKRPLPFALKLMLVVGTPAFFIAALTPAAVTVAFGAALAVFQLAALGAIVVVELGRARRATRTEREIRRALSLGGAVCVLGVATDWLPVFGVGEVGYGAVGVLSFVWCAASALHAGGAFRLRAQLARGLGLLALAALAGAIAAGVAPGTDVVAVAVVIALGWIVLSPIRAATLELGARPQDLLLERIAALPTDHVDALLRALRSWPEVKAVDRLDAGALDAHQLRELPEALRALGGVLDEPTALAAVHAATDDAALMRAERVRHFFIATGHNAAVALDDAAVLGLTFIDATDGALYRPALRSLASLVHLTARVGGATRAAQGNAH